MLASFKRKEIFATVSSVLCKLYLQLMHISHDVLLCSKHTRFVADWFCNLQWHTNWQSELCQQNGLNWFTYWNLVKTYRRCMRMRYDMRLICISTVDIDIDSLLVALVFGSSTLALSISYHASWDLCFSLITKSPGPWLEWCSIMQDWLRYFKC